jgi:hypothetical protein
MCPSFETAARLLKVALITTPVHSDVEIETAIIALGRHSPINTQDHWWNAIGDHYISPLIPILNQMNTPGSGVSITPVPTEADPYLGLPIVPIVGGSSAIVSNGRLYMLDPPSGSRFVLSLPAGSAVPASLLLPDDGSGIGSFKVWTESNGAWSQPMSYPLGSVVNLSPNIQAVQFEAFDASGHLKPLASQYEFFATFAGSGTLTGGVSQLNAPSPSDFNGDGTSDILWRNNAIGDTGFYQMNVSGTLQGWHDIGSSSTAYTVVGIGDFNDDGVTDVLWRNNATGDTGFYQMNSNGTLQGWHEIGGSSTAYTVVGVGDFTGNGNDDILFRNNATGDTGFYAISNGANTGWQDIGGSSTSYSVVGVGDFLGTGTSDILFRNNATGDIGFYAIRNGVNTGWHDLGGASTAYTVVGIGDFYGTGTSDILFRNNSTGDVGFYAISNGVNTGWHDIGGSSTAYSVAAVGDYFGNGTDDILFRNSTTGDTGFYAISKGVNTGWHDVGGSSTAYQVVR